MRNICLLQDTGAGKWEQLYQTEPPGQGGDWLLVPVTVGEPSAAAQPGADWLRAETQLGHPRDYVSFQSDIGAYQSGRFYTKPPQCVDIPADLRLCHNVGYKRMVLPNLLEHETMAEVAPVCLDRPIYPCRWLCEAVRDSCEPVMQFFGFYWPEMLNEYDYVSFQSDIGAYQSGRFYTKPPQCVDIPADLRLCHNVGYKRMVLPNLLEHETMAEVKQQASSWVPLLNKNCHMGTQVFLCALFAPVCLDRPIYPCRWLCEAVRDSCEPVMQFFGFYWPEMLKCDKFPEGDVCIAMTPPNATEASRPQGTTVCPPCDNELKSEAIIEHLCASEFALRMKIKEVKKENGDKKIVPKKKKPLKLGPIKKKELKRLVLFLKNGADCPCHQLDNLSPHFLIMGRKVKGQYLLTAIHKWDKKNKEFKNFMKKMKNHECPTFQSVFK
ncbi:Secreted frizzled-related protein 1 [Heterocephalus glaber]|uniref:Secreted frizzled-related protein 1 n=1 Tax=Heterocephalus glaber TaxID=10181 RepID=G5BZ48_HETGA|nr:Secreted frizzled-related protein 1 [Heterocephalus glaber]